MPEVCKDAAPPTQPPLAVTLQLRAAGPFQGHPSLTRLLCARMPLLQLEHIRPCCWLQKGAVGLRAQPELPSLPGGNLPNNQPLAEAGSKLEMLVSGGGKPSRTATCCRLGSPSSMGEKGNPREQVQVGCWEKVLNQRGAAHCSGSPGQQSWPQTCWILRSVWTRLSETWFEFWVVVCGVRSWTQ